jgi:hypothetical protein
MQQVKGVNLYCTNGDRKVGLLRHGHPLLADARYQLTRKAVQLAVKYARAQAVDGAKINLIGVGDGPTTLRSVMGVLKDYPDVYYHSMSPCTCPKDIIRRAKMDTIELKPNVTVCSCVLSECSCISDLDNRVFISVHSSYYFGCADWARLRPGEQMFTVVHPFREAKGSFPAVNPEYNYVVENGVVEMKPVNPCGTTYRHPNITSLLDRGFRIPGWYVDDIGGDLCFVTEMCDAVMSSDGDVIANMYHMVAADSDDYPFNFDELVDVVDFVAETNHWRKMFPGMYREPTLRESREALTTVVLATDGELNSPEDEGESVRSIARTLALRVSHVTSPNEMMKTMCMHMASLSTRFKSKQSSELCEVYLAEIAESLKASKRVAGYIADNNAERSIVRGELSVADNGLLRLYQLVQSGSLFRRHHLF